MANANWSQIEGFILRQKTSECCTCCINQVSLRAPPTRYNLEPKNQNRRVLRSQTSTLRCIRMSIKKDKSI